MNELTERVNVERLIHPKVINFTNFCPKCDVIDIDNMLTHAYKLFA